MEKERARDIMNSVENLQVIYKEDPVWIERVDPEKDEAEVIILGINQTAKVPVTQLKETGHIMKQHQ